MRHFFSSMFVFFNLFIPFFFSEVNAQEYTNFIGMKFVTIPKGSFYMGSCAPSDSSPYLADCEAKKLHDIYAFDDEFPRRQVEITKDVQVGVLEVTVEQFNRASVYAELQELQKNIDFLTFNMKQDRPVTFLSWHEVQHYIGWLNREKPQEDKGIYRLPTEAEWEYVARAGGQGIYFFGNNANLLKKYSWYYENALKKGAEMAQPVGQKAPNSWGIFDISGNVWEWVSDWYDSTYYQNRDQKDPTGIESGNKKVIRGGAFNFDSSYCRAAARESYPPKARSRSIGFRVVREMM